jgi:hypothetical protein
VTGPDEQPSSHMERTQTALDPAFGDTCQRDHLGWVYSAGSIEITFGLMLEIRPSRSV